MHTEATEVTTYEEVMEAWDQYSVLVRQDGDAAFVYPQLGRGYSYPEVKLHTLATLVCLPSVEVAKLWATSKGYAVTEVK
jgi:hypothetical protein